jgi:exonuclease I
LNFCRRFHQISPPDKAILAHHLTNPKLKKLTIRLLGRHYPDAMSTEQSQDFAEYMQQVKAAETSPLIDFKGNIRLSSESALREITELRKIATLDQTQLSLLDELEKYLVSKMN